MSAHELLRELDAAGAALTVCGQYLDVDAPAGVLSEAIIAQLRQSKPEILCLLRMRACIPVDHEGLPFAPALPAAGGASGGRRRAANGIASPASRAGAMARGAARRGNGASSPAA
jgi:hypothetical protein